MPTVHLFPNPYHHLDHKGRLAGIAFQLEPRAPHRRLIGARISMVDGSYVPDSVERDIESLGVLGHGDVFHFFGDEPVAVQCADEICRRRCGCPAMGWWWAAARGARCWRVRRPERASPPR